MSASKSAATVKPHGGFESEGIPAFVRAACAYFQAPKGATIAQLKASERSPGVRESGEIPLHGNAKKGDRNSTALLRER